MAKRTLDSFFTSPSAKKSRLEEDETVKSKSDVTEKSMHPTYPFALAHLPSEVTESLNFTPSAEPRAMNDRPHLDLLYYQPYLGKDLEHPLFEFLRRELFFYRVKYQIKRGSIETQINTPRWTTVFGLDETSCFEDGNIVDAKTGKPTTKEYKCRPRPIPQCLDHLRVLTENATGCKFNFCLVNYYASGDDSISYHSDDERFLGPDPAIASFSMGAKRDFLLRHKPTPQGHSSEKDPIKLPLASGDMILMRGKTQSNWLHSIPKRKGGEAGKGRINITFRRAMVKGGTENYYKYNVGDGEVYKWNPGAREMRPWAPSGAR